jgi:hypothetical protein
MGLMLSPDSPVILGNSVGFLGPAFFGFVVVFGLIFTDPGREELVKYMCVSAMVIALFSRVSGGRRE